MTTYKSILAIFVSPTDLKVIAVVGTVLNTIINLIFLPVCITSSNIYCYCNSIGVTG
jgi:hypothetical protein